MKCKGVPYQKPHATPTLVTLMTSREGSLDIHFVQYESIQESVAVMVMISARCGVRVNGTDPLHGDSWNDATGGSTELGFFRK